MLPRSLGDKYRPAPLMETYVKAGRLGRKVGRGVYDYDDDGNRITSYDQRLKVPDAWLRSYQELRSKNIAAGRRCGSSRKCSKLRSSRCDW